MLESIKDIFSHYIDGASRYTIHSVDMERGENPEDLYYLCAIGDRWFLVYETDYIVSLSNVLDEAVSIFAGNKLQPLYWVVRKDYQTSTGATTIPIGTKDLDAHWDALVLDHKDSYLRQVVIEFESLAEPQKRYNPNAYGHSS